MLKMYVDMQYYIFLNNAHPGFVTMEKGLYFCFFIRFVIACTCMPLVCTL